MDVNTCGSVLKGNFCVTNLVHDLMQDYKRGAHILRGEGVGGAEALKKQSDTLTLKLAGGGC